MKKTISYLSCLLVSFFTILRLVSAAGTGYINGTGVRLRSGPGTTYSNLKTLTIGDSLTILGEKNASNSGCNTNLWYNVRYGSTEGYVCSEFVTLDLSNSTVTDKDFAQNLKNQGFPDSYVNALTILHQKYPNWVFKPLKVSTDFNTVVSKEATGTRSLIQGDEGYRSTASNSYDYLTNKFQVKDGSNWYIANSATIAYYLDPRNWLSESSIFMFEDLSYQVTNKTESIVKSIASQTKLGSYDSKYVTHIMDAGKSANTSPIYLASRIRQEIGSSTAVISGASFSYNGKSYSKLYNPYNIGATSGSDNWKKGLIWANGGESGSTKTYSRPWKSLETAIKGGAKYISESYISKNQNSPYLQKFNVNNGVSNIGSHQYMQNIMAPSSEASIAYSAYNKAAVIKEQFIFSIPVYNNMPSKTSLPNKGNPNNYLNKIRINGEFIFTTPSTKTDYTYTVPGNSTTVQIDTWRLTTKSTVVKEGKFNLTGDKTLIPIQVIAQNGDKRTYNITIVKDKSNTNSQQNNSGNSSNKKALDVVKETGYKANGKYLTGLKTNLTVSSLKSNLSNHGGSVTVKNSKNASKNSGNIATGDVVIITSNGNTESYTVVVYGDINGDGKISLSDLAKTQKQILHFTSLSGAYFEASDVNKDGKVSLTDLAKIQKSILGFGGISQ